MDIPFHSLKIERLKIIQMCLMHQNEKITYLSYSDKVNTIYVEGCVNFNTDWVSIKDVMEYSLLALS
jgi:hypothetical protein